MLSERSVLAWDKPDVAVEFLGSEVEEVVSHGQHKIWRNQYSRPDCNFILEVFHNDGANETVGQLLHLLRGDFDWRVGRVQVVFLQDVYFLVGQFFWPQNIVTDFYFFVLFFDEFEEDLLFFCVGIGMLGSEGKYNFEALKGFLEAFLLF